MLEKTDFDGWCDRLGLPDEVQALVHRIRNSPPTRAVGSFKGNVIGRFPSRKMGVTIQFESHKNELPFIHEYEYDTQVLEYYDQPPPIKLTYEAANGRRLGVFHTPDFFIIRTSEAGWEECKTEADLIKLSAKNTQRYLRDEEGRWRCPPGEAYAESCGFYYRVRSSEEINWTYQRNVEFLDRCFRSDSIVAETARIAALAQAKSQPGISLKDLFQALSGCASREDLFLLIAGGELYVDLHSAPLVEPEKVLVFTDENAAKAFEALIHTSAQSRADTPPLLALTAGSPVQWDGKGWMIANVGETKIGLIGEDSKFIEVPTVAFERLIHENRIVGVRLDVPTSIHPDAKKYFEQADQSAFAEANRRFEIVRAYIHGAPLPTMTNLPERTLRLWAARYRSALEAYGTGYVGLLPRRTRGNTVAKLPTATQALMDEFIENEYETLKQKNKYTVYASFLRACEQLRIPPASYKTFIKRVKMRSRHQQVSKRKGAKAAYQHKEFYWELTPTTPRHGERPFHIAHIDHTELDVELVCSVTGQNLGRPWLTILMDAFSRRILAVYLTFDPPSYRSCMMVIRECVRRFNRLPQVVVVDGGLDFSSTYFETLLARYECTKKTRPPAQSRFGSVGERFFGTTDTRFIHNLQGNTQITRNVRQVTKSNSPREQAIWTLEKLYQYLSEWVYEVYDTIEHPTLFQSPRDAFALGMLNAGERTHELINYNSDFLMFTFPTTSKGTAKVQPGRGVKINYIYYWSEAFRNPVVEDTQVQVRYDPFDSSVAHVYVGRQWVECISQHPKMFRNHSERELMIATAELRGRQIRHSGRSNITALKLAEFIASVEPEEVLLRQRTADKEVRNILHVIHGDSKAQVKELTETLSSTTDTSLDTQSSNPQSPDSPANTSSPELYEEF
jgi:putative transposase